MRAGELCSQSHARVFLTTSQKKPGKLHLRTHLGFWMIRRMLGPRHCTMELLKLNHENRHRLKVRASQHCQTSIVSLQVADGVLCMSG